MGVENNSRAVSRSPSRVPSRGAADGAGLYVYADSVNGNNANDGLTALTPKQTITAALTVAASTNRHLRLTRGSHWREVLNLPSGRNAYAYGSGAAPILDASDVAPNASFSKTAGLTNVYQISWAHSITDSQSLHSVWIDGVRMTRVTSTANCDTTAGSFFAAAPSAGTPTTIYVHAPGDTNPTSDGKVYEITKREYGIYMPGNNTIDGLYARFCAHTSGCIYAFDNCTIRNCTAKDGWRHNLLMGKNCICSDTIAEDIEGSTSGSSFFVDYSATAGGSAQFIRCTARGNVSIYNDGGGGNAGFYAHRGTGTADQIDYIGCTATNVVQAYGASTTLLNVTRCKATDFMYGVALLNNATITGCFFNGLPGSNSRRMVRAIDGSSQQASGTVTAKGNVIIGSQGISFGGLIWSLSGTGVTWDVRQNTIILSDRQSYTTAFAPFNGTGGNVTFKQNIVYNLDQGPSIGANLTSNAALDSNVYFPSTMDGTWSGTGYTTIAAYQAASGKDGLSSTSDPSFVNTTFSGWTSVADAAVNGSSPAVALQAGATYYVA